MSASSPHIDLLQDLVILGFPPTPVPSPTLTEADVVLHFSIQQLVQAARFLFTPAPTSLSSLAKANVDAAISLLLTVNPASPTDDGGAAALATHLPHVDVIRRIAALGDPTTEQIADRVMRQSVAVLSQWASAVFERFTQESKPEPRPPVLSSDADSPTTIPAGSMAGPTPTADLHSESVPSDNQEPPTPSVRLSRSTPDRSMLRPFSPLRTRRSRHPQFFSP
ncbi:hypothetical protein F5X98DRAFT_381444 [Xylaria grammica]|nr:hypothetical protein F5X98DRAFT_381444 [Xylaria grammica]